MPAAPIKFAVRVATLATVLLHPACTDDDVFYRAVAEQSGVVKYGYPAASVWYDVEACGERPPLAPGSYGEVDPTTGAVRDVETSWPVEDGAVSMRSPGAAYVALDVFAGDCFWGEPIWGPESIEWCSTVGCVSLFALERVGGAPWGHSPVGHALMPRVALGFSE
jgi:hypothetical protein